MSERSVGRLHLVGPLPPPLGGGTVTFRAFRDEVQRTAAERGITAIRVTDTSPRRLRTSSGLGAADVLRGVRLLAAIAATPLHSNGLIFFASDKLLLRTTAVLRLVRRAGVPVVVKLIGSGLDRTLHDLAPRARSSVVDILSSLTAVLAQTGTLVEMLQALGVASARRHPGFREVHARPLRDTVARPGGGPLRLVHLGLVSEEKGIFRAIEAVRVIGGGRVALDVYGDVHPRDADRFAQLIAGTPGCTYHGVYEGDPATLLANHDALVLASTHPGEGHAGVVIEAMAAGIPAIVSDQPGLPELVSDGVGGFVVPRGEGPALARAIQRLVESPALRASMGERSREALARHDVRDAVSSIIGLLEAKRSAPPVRTS